jgi:PHD/YefM family antitoxin component YafN of YafNO toxin-antitoxin module
MTADDNGANVILNLHDFSHLMTHETLLKQTIYDALNVSDAIMDRLL